MSEYTIEGGNIRINLVDLVGQLSDEDVDAIADVISWEKILERFDAHVTGDSDFWSMSDTRGGHNIREHIERIQGTKDERVKDLEYRIARLESKLNYAEEYKTWYWRWYHSPLVDDNLRQRYLSMVGKPSSPKPESELEIES